MPGDFPAAEDQDLTHQPATLRHGIDHAHEPPRRSAVARHFAQRLLQQPRHRRQQIVEVMGDAAGHAAQRFHLQGLPLHELALLGLGLPAVQRPLLGLGDSNGSYGGSQQDGGAGNGDQAEHGQMLPQLASYAVQVDGVGDIEGITAQPADSGDAFLAVDARFDDVGSAGLCRGPWRNRDCRQASMLPGGGPRSLARIAPSARIRITAGFSLLVTLRNCFSKYAGDSASRITPSNASSGAERRRATWKANVPVMRPAAGVPMRTPSPSCCALMK